MKRNIQAAATANLHEEWRPIANHPHYEVSSFGNVRSLDHETIYTKKCGVRSVVRHKGRIISSTNKRYPRVGIGRPRRYYSVHRLVCAAFLGDPGDLQVNHKNGNKCDNRIENLEYVTPLENKHHAMATGLCDARGEMNSQSKLTESDVLAIRLSSLSLQKLALQYGVSDVAIGLIVRRKAWRHVA